MEIERVAGATGEGTDLKIGHYKAEAQVGEFTALNVGAFRD
jgi:hypothetical protein